MLMNSPDPSVVDFFHRVRFMVALSALAAGTLLTGCGNALGSHASVTPSSVQTAVPAVASKLDRHVKGFAFGYCSRSLGGKGLPEPLLEVVTQQGQFWTNIVVENSRGDVQIIFVLVPLLDELIAQTPMALVRDDPTGEAVPAPIYFCDEITQHPEVQAALQNVKIELAPAYENN
jgi:hypothetical protein